jgi:hypothetical protein
VLSQVCSQLRKKKFPSLYKFPTFNVRNDLRFCLLFLNISGSLLIICYIAGNLQYGIENKRLVQFQYFDLLHYIRIMLILYYVFFSAPCPNHANFDDKFSASFPNNAVSSPYICADFVLNIVSA